MSGVAFTAGPRSAVSVGLSQTSGVGNVNPVEFGIELTSDGRVCRVVSSESISPLLYQPPWIHCMFTTTFWGVSSSCMHAWLSTTTTTTIPPETHTTARVCIL